MPRRIWEMLPVATRTSRAGDVASGPLTPSDPSASVLRGASPLPDGFGNPYLFLSALPDTAHRSGRAGRDQRALSELPWRGHGPGAGTRARAGCKACSSPSSKNCLKDCPESGSGAPGNRGRSRAAPRRGSSNSEQTPDPAGAPPRIRPLEQCAHQHPAEH